MRIVMVGTGYVGLVSGACLAELGHEVICADSDDAKIGQLTLGDVPVHEPGLAELVAKHAGNRLRFTSDLTGHLSSADAIFIAVGTPATAAGKADLSAVFEVAEQIAPYLTSDSIVVIKSTVPVGTAQQLIRSLAEHNPSAKVDVASNPEFLREGAAISDFLFPDRIIVGTESNRVRSFFERLYAPLSQSGVPLVFMANEAAELTKYAANNYLAMRIAYVNELADICEAVGADISEVTNAMGLDHRIGHHYLSPGPGFGGSCLPKDTRALMATTRTAGVEFRLGEAIIAANEFRKQGLVSRVARAVGGEVAGKRIAVLGLAFKADTDDIRDSAAIPLIRALLDQGAEVSAYDPAAMVPAQRVLQGIDWCHDSFEAATGADAAVIVTEWEAFRALDLRRLATVMREPVLVDFRNLFELAEVAAAGLSYVSIGRAAVERLASVSRSAVKANRDRKPGSAARRLRA